MRIAIVDDDKVFVEKLQRELENFSIKKKNLCRYSVLTV